MRKTLALLVLLAPLTAFAAPDKYVFDLGASDVTPNGGTGSFFWDPATATISGLNWDFGGGLVGFVDDSLANWSAPIGSTTIGIVTFDIFTGKGGLGCGCVSGFYDFNGLTGFPTPGLGGNIGFEAQNVGIHDYQIRLSPNDTYHYGSLSVATLAPTSVPEPGMLSLLALGLVSVLFVRRRRSG